MIDRISSFAGVNDMTTHGETEMRTMQEVEVDGNAPMDSYLLWDGDGISLETEKTNATYSQKVGVLIVDNTSQKELSISSVPSDLGSIQDSTLSPIIVRDCSNSDTASDIRSPPSNNAKTPWLSAVLTLSLTVALLLAAYLTYERQSFLQKQQELELRLQQVIELQQQQQQQAQNTNVSKDDILFLDGEDPTQPVLKTDNCWFKAKIELGDCAHNALDCLGEFGSGLYGKLFREGMDGQVRLAGVAGAALHEASTIVAATAVKLMDTLWFGAKQMDEAILAGVEYTRDALEEASPSRHLK